MAVEPQAMSNDLQGAPYSYRIRMTALNDRIAMYPVGGKGAIDFSWVGEVGAGGAASVEFQMGPRKTVDWADVAPADATPNVVHHVTVPILGMRWTYSTVQGRYVISIVSQYPMWVGEYT